MTITYTFAPGAIIYASRFNTNFSDVKNWADTHELLNAAVHGITGNFVDTGSIQSITAVKTFTNTVNFNGDVVFDTTTLFIDHTNHRVGINTITPADKFHIVATVDAEEVTRITSSGVATSLTTQIYNSDATKRFLQRYDFNTNLYTFQSDTGVFLAMNRATGNLSIPTGKQLQFDSASVAGNDYITSPSNGRMQMFLNGTLTFDVGNGSTTYLISQSFAISSLSSLYLDGGSDSGLIESAANQIDIFTGGSNRMRFLAGGSIQAFGAFAVPSGTGVFFDGGSDTYIQEALPNILDVITGGAGRMRFSSSDPYCQSFGSISVPSGSYLYLFGTTANWRIRFNSAGGGGNGVFEFGTNGFTIEMLAGGQLLLGDASAPFTINYATRRSFAKAGGYITGATGAIIASNNIASCTRTGAGSYTINLTNAMSSTNSYWVTCTANTLVVPVVTHSSASQIIVNLYNLASALTDANFNFSVHGT